MGVAHRFHPPKGPKLKTFLSDIVVKASKDNVPVDDTVTFTMNFTVLGGLRDVLNPDVWEAAYQNGEREFRVRFEIYLGKRTARLLFKELVKPRKILRRAKFYWSRDPGWSGEKIGYHTRIWTMIIREPGEPILPKSVEAAKSLLHDHSQNFTIPASSLGKGRHSIVAKVNVKWGRHVYIEKGSVSRTSRPIKVTCS